MGDGAKVSKGLVLCINSYILKILRYELICTLHIRKSGQYKNIYKSESILKLVSPTRLRSGARRL
jgi:hypothetical protein